MAADVSKHLDRAKRFLEKNRVEDAIEAYLAVLDAAPQHQEATQALGDLYARMDQPDRAADYYGLLFDLLDRAERRNQSAGDLQSFSSHRPQAPAARTHRALTPFCSRNRIASTKPSSNTAKLRKSLTRPAAPKTPCFAGNVPPARARKSCAAIAPGRSSGAHREERAGRTGVSADWPTGLGGQSENGEALEFLGRAHNLAPQERSVALLYADATLKSGDAARSRRTPGAFRGDGKRRQFSRHLCRRADGVGTIDRAREVLEGLLREKNEGATPPVRACRLYVKAGQDGKPWKS